MHQTKNQQLSLNVNVFVFLSNFMTQDHWSSHNETAASAWPLQNADWWSEMKKTNHDTHHPENSLTTRCGAMDTDDEAAGGLRSTNLHHIIAAALEGHEKQPTAYHALKNNYNSPMCASYWPTILIKMQLDHQFPCNKISRPQIILMKIIFHCLK